MEESFEVRDQRLQDWVWTTKSLLHHPDCDEKMYKAYCGIAAHANNVTQKAFPSIDLLRKEINMGRNTLLRAISKLEAFQFIGVERKIGCPNIYVLLAIPEKSPPRGKGRSGQGEEKPFNWDEYLLGMAENKQRHIKIMAYFFQRKKLKFTNLKQVQVAIKQHTTAASKLDPFEKDKIVWAMDTLDRNFPGWTLNTIVKELTK